MLYIILIILLFPHIFFLNNYLLDKNFKKIFNLQMLYKINE